MVESPYLGLGLAGGLHQPPAKSQISCKPGHTTGFLLEALKTQINLIFYEIFSMRLAYNINIID